MSRYEGLFYGKRITVMGLGLLGRGVGDIVWLARQGAELIVTDLKSAEALVESVKQLQSFDNVTFVLGEHRLKDFQNRDLILKAASVPLDSPFIAEARKNRIPVDMSASLFARIADIPIVGVTGTRGKSTVTHLIAAILAADDRSVVLGGNVRGVSNLALLDKVTPDSVGVFELDSWQLQGFGETNTLLSGLRNPTYKSGPISPNVAVFTTFMDDHLNYYDGNRDAYLADKANIFLHQSPDDVLVVGRQVAELLQKKYKRDIVSRVVIADEATVPKKWKLLIPGLHNHYNAGVAIAAARELGVDDTVIRSAVEKFKGLPGRLELLREVNGVKIYNDNNATTPDATVAALSALDTGMKNIVLIMGGSDKGLDMTALVEALGTRTKSVVLLKGTGTGKLQLHNQGITSVTVDTLAEAVERALHTATPGDSILFSPAFASFGMFKNEYDRGDRFNVLVSNLPAQTNIHSDR